MPFVWLRYDRFIGEKEPSNALDRVQYHYWNKDYVGDKARKAWEADLVDEVKGMMRPGDLTLVYRRGAFLLAHRYCGGSLDELQRATISGYHTDWCVEMATRSARDLGFMPIVVSDACGTTHPLHEQTLDQINDCYAPVISTNFAIEALRRAAGLNEF